MDINSNKHGPYELASNPLLTGKLLHTKLYTNMCYNHLKTFILLIVMCSAVNFINLESTYNVG